MTSDADKLQLTLYRMTWNNILRTVLFSFDCDAYFLCVYVCYVLVVLFVYVCMDGCGGQRSMFWPSSVTLHLVFKVGPFTEPGAPWLGKSHLANKLWYPPVSPPQNQSYWCSPPTLVCHVTARDPNSVSCACMACTLLNPLFWCMFSKL